MYITKCDNENNPGFDWHSYFLKEGLNDKAAIYLERDQKEIIHNVRETLKENPFLMALTFTKLMRKLLKDVNLRNNLNVLELGAGTGFLTKWLLDQYSGEGTLVDNNETSYDYFKSQKFNDSYNLKYIHSDVFELNLNRSHDVVCSFGLLEHFKEKKDILDIHKKFLKPNGYIIILVPLDSMLNRIYWEVYPELNLGYRELLTEKEFQQCLQKEGLNVLGTEVSKGYSFDFVGAICSTM